MLDFQDNLVVGDTTTFMCSFATSGETRRIIATGHCQWCDRARPSQRPLSEAKPEIMVLTQEEHRTAYDHQSNGMIENAVKTVTSKLITLKQCGG